MTGAHTPDGAARVGRYLRFATARAATPSGLSRFASSCKHHIAIAALCVAAFAVATFAASFISGAAQ